MSAPNTPLLPLLDEIEAASKDYTPGIAYDTRWYEWTLKLAAICRKAFRPPEELAEELDLARPAIEAAKARLKLEREFLAEADEPAIAVEWFHAWWKALHEDPVDPLLTEEPETLALNTWLVAWSHHKVEE